MSYILNDPTTIFNLLMEHLQLSMTALLIASAIAVPLGVLISRRPRLAAPVMGVLSILYTIPSLALIIMLLPLFGLNATSVIVALILYAQVILVRNVVAGLASINPSILQAATGMGMNSWQRWWLVEMPLALPVILAGIRIAVVVCIAIATIGAKFAAGGLGTLLFDGIAQGRNDKIWAGAIMVSALALAANWLLVITERTSSAARQLGGRNDFSTARVVRDGTPHVR